MTIGEAEGQIYFEHIRCGGSVKCSAIDAGTGIEVSITGPAIAPRDALESLALKKLKMVLPRKEKK
ncbi:MAG: hypothetical protein PSN37_02785 [Alphaproteobacteria bacterium]|nr:hypothetical protein [Alphaproteobacteria bacterium]